MIMKKTLFMLIIAALIFVSCDKDKDTTYTVTFDANGGSPAPQAQTVKAGEKAVAPANPAKQGYVFMYWSLTGAIGAYNFETPVNSNITLQAKWEDEATAEYWQVLWELNGGAWPSGNNHASTVVKGGTLAEPNAPEKTGDIFEGWYREAEFTNKVTFPYNVSEVTADITLYAKWQGGSGGGEGKLYVIYPGKQHYVFTDGGGTSETINIYTDQPSWNVVSNQTWCTVNKTAENQFTITVAAYTGKTMRNAMVTLSAGNADNYIVEVSQIVGNGAYLFATPNAPISFSNVGTMGGGNVVIEVTTNQSTWTATSDQGWCNVIIEDYKPSFFFNVPCNYSGIAREATITITAGDATPINITVTQAGGTFLEITFSNSIRNDWSIDAKARSMDYYIETNQPLWDAVSNQSWCTATKVSERTLRISAAPNATGLERSATITVTGGVASPKTLTVIQSAIVTNTFPLEDAVYCMAYAINVSRMYNDQGLKPSSISGILTAFYTQASVLDYVKFVLKTAVAGFRAESGRRPSVILAESTNQNISSAATALQNGTYDYAKDPASVRAYFTTYMGNSLPALSDLKRIANNDAITEELYSKMSFPTNCYKMIIYGTNSLGKIGEKLYGKYIGYSLDGKTYNYWIIDPEHPSFGQYAIINSPTY